MSRHLRILRRAGLVEENDLEDDARVRLYRLRQEPFLELRAWLDDVEGFWTDQLEAFKEREGWRQLMLNGMKKDFSWSRSAREYVKVYERAMQNRVAER